MPDQSGKHELTRALDDQTKTLVDEVTDAVTARGDASERPTVVVDLRKTIKESRRPRRRAGQSLTAAEAECLRVIAKDVRAKRNASGLNLPLDHWSELKIEKFMGALRSLRKRRVLELVTRVHIDRVVVMPGPFDKHVKPLIAGPRSRRPTKPTKKPKPDTKQRR
jgi:hypothetical protein